MSVTFRDRVVLVTGAGRGLGEAYARLVAELGGTVIVHDGGVERDGTGGDAGPANAVAENIRGSGGQAFAESVNLNSREACEGLIERTAQQFGRLDGLAGEAAGSGIRVNVISPVAGTRIFRDQWRAADLPVKNVAAAVALLASESCPWNGVVLRASGGRYCLGQFVQGQEVHLRGTPAPDEVLEALQ